MSASFSRLPGTSFPRLPGTSFPRLPGTSFPRLPGTGGPEWLRFSLADVEYAIPLEAVTEVTAARTPTFVPLVPLEIGGILNVRGEPLPAVDGRALVRAAGERGARPALVLEQGSIRLGLLVDAVSSIERHLGEARPDESLAEERAPELPGVEWVRHDGQRLGLVDADVWMSQAMALLTKQGGHSAAGQ